MFGFKVLNYCFTCGKEHEDVGVDKPVMCECGGYVVSPSGKGIFKLVPAVPVWLIQANGETFRVAAATEADAIRLLEKEYGEDEEMQYEVSEITDPNELRRKFIHDDESGRGRESIMDILTKTPDIEFPMLISTSVW